MTRVAYLTSRDMVPGADHVRDDLFELNHQLAALRPACAERGMDLELAVWDDPDFDPSAYGAIAIGTTWDYTANAGAFLETLDRFAERTPVFNVPALVRWNAHKNYLRDLEAAGVPVVPTEWIDAASDAAIRQAMGRLGTDDAVVKPIVGAGAHRQIRVRPGRSMPRLAERPRGAAMVQPFLPSIQQSGELSVILIDGSLSHAVQKLPVEGDYRVQSIYGGRERAAHPAADELEVCDQVLDTFVDWPLYARVDLVRHVSQPVVMEVELIEPYLYPLQGPELGSRYAAALADRL